MLITGLRRAGLIVVVLAALSGCQATTDAPSGTARAIAEVQARDSSLGVYPVPGTTYLHFDHAHGFQVEFVAPGGKAWLWYPGNQRGVPEEWKLDTVSGIKAICYRHPSNSYNPVTKTGGGGFSCQPLDLSKKRAISQVKGDPFNLASGRVPYPLGRCQAPDGFAFNRTRYRC